MSCSARTVPVAKLMDAPRSAISVVRGLSRFGLTTVRVSSLGLVGEIDAEPLSPARVFSGAERADIAVAADGGRERCPEGLGSQGR